MVILLYTFVLFAYFSTVCGFSFTIGGELVECGDLNIEWSGGTGPYQLAILPSFGTQRIISIPDSAYVNGKGTYSTPLEQPKDRKLVFTMSDSTGFGTGGSTNVMVVGPSTGATCNTTEPDVGFSYQLNTALTQCRPYLFEAYDRAVQPVTITVVVPGGTSTVLSPPVGQSFTWLVNVAAETSLIFMMSDSRGNLGGVSDLKIVGASDDKSCLNDRSISSTAAPTPPTPTGLPSQTSSAPAASDTTDSRNGVSIGAIAGTVIGSLLFLAVIVTLGLFFLKNCRNKAKEHRPSGYPLPVHSDSKSFDPSHQRPNFASTHEGAVDLSSQNPFDDPAHHLRYNQYNQSQDPFHTPLYPPSPAIHPQPADPFNPNAPIPWSQQETPMPRDVDRSSTTLSSAPFQRKAAMAGEAGYQPSRYIVHKDLEDVAQPNPEPVVEIPPVYTQRRALSFKVANPSPPSPTGQNYSRSPFS